MKNCYFSHFILAIFLFFAVYAMPAEAKPVPGAGSLIKGKGLATVYYLGEDGKRYVFPNDKSFFSWYDDFSAVEEIDMNELQKYPLGGNVRYKPGAVMVKIQTDPKVYAVGANGELRWVRTEALARAFYGQYWNKMIDDVPDSFFANYLVAPAVETEDDYDPEDEQEQAPTISHNRGFKPLVKIQSRERQIKMCGRLEGALNRLQKRIARFGIELPDLGDEILEKCYGLAANDNVGLGTKKVTLCHNGQTITVGAPAARAHLRHGDYLGPCVPDGVIGPDTTAPAISNVAAAPAVNSALITWDTNEAADSLARYATSSLATASYVKSVSASAKVTAHSLALTGLEDDTTYYYTITSKDTAGNTATSSQKSFKTLVETDTTAPAISSVNKTISAASAAINWTTDEPATSQVRYATSTLTAAWQVYEVSDASLKTGHSVGLSGLTASTKYYFRISSSDEAGNTASTTEDHFTTLAE